MAEYRVNLMGSDGRFASSRTFVCDTDENAIVWAREIAGEQPAELWIESRCTSAQLSKMKPSAMKFMKVA